MSEEDISLISSIIKDFTRELKQGTLTLGTKELASSNQDYIFARIHSTAIKALNWNSEKLESNLKFLSDIGITSLLEHLESIRPELKGYESVVGSGQKLISCNKIL